MKKTSNFNQDNKKESMSLKILKFFSGDFWFNKYVLIFAFIYILSCVGGTYAYLSFSAENSNTIVGVTADPSIDLVVNQVVPASSNDGAMVPQLESALGTAKSSQYNCVDGNGNVVCKVYRAVVTNDGNANISVKGTVSFTGIDAMPNLKWKRISSATSIGSYTSNTASGSDVSFETEYLLEVDESKTYYFVVWIDEIGVTQTDSGTFRMIIKFNSANGTGITSTIGEESTSGTISTPFITDVMAVNATSDANIDFSVVSSSSGTNGIYYVADTINDTNPIYYYRGAVDNNLLFANTCWKIVRTTETGGLKLIYNGTPSSGTCNNTGTSSQIGTKEFNSSYDSPAYVGYMYGTPYTYSSKSMSSDTTAYVYGNDITYSGGIYTLSSTISNSSWSSIYSSGLNSNHYTCWTEGTTCTSVYYIYYTNSSKAYYITLTNGKTVEDALEEMLDNNTTSSTIKGNSTTEGTLDYWYYTNIEQAGYSSYIEDTVWCNDRSISDLGGWNPDGGSTTSNLYFSGDNRAYSTYEPSLTCSRDIDKFTVSESNGNGDLDYPVGLLTSDEIMLEGGIDGTSNSSYYVITGSSYWAGSPSGFNYDGAFEFYVYSTGDLGFDYVDTTRGVRPSISLAAGFTISGGDGTTSSPYVVG